MQNSRTIIRQPSSQKKKKKNLAHLKKQEKKKKIMHISLLQIAFTKFGVNLILLHMLKIFGFLSLKLAFIFNLIILFMHVNGKTVKY